MKFPALALFLVIPAAAFAKQSFFEEARREIAAILGNKAFKKYSAYTITGIRQGEGKDQGQTYFVTLEKPFTSPAEKACLAFQSRKARKWEMVGKEGDCKE